MKMDLKTMWRIFVYEINAKKQGMLIGAGVGLLAAWYFVSKGADLNAVVEGGKGLVDAVFNRQSALEVAKYKMFIAFAFFGALIGYVGEWLFDKFGFFRSKRIKAKRRR